MALFIAVIYFVKVVKLDITWKFQSASCPGYYKIYIFSKQMSIKKFTLQNMNKQKRKWNFIWIGKIKEELEALLCLGVTMH